MPYTRGYRLMPFDMESLALLQNALRNREVWQPYSWFGFGRLAGPYSGGTENQAAAVYQLMIESADGACVGRVTWQKGGSYGGPEEHRGWLIGVLVLPEHRNSGAAYAGIKLVVDYLFSTTPANRIESFTSGLQHHQAVREPAGMHFEGWLRGAQWRDGEWHDVASYAITRADWAAGRTESGAADVTPSVGA